MLKNNVDPLATRPVVAAKLRNILGNRRPQEQAQREQTVLANMKNMDKRVSDWRAQRRLAKQRSVPDMPF